MSDLFNYRNSNLIGSVVEGYEYNYTKKQFDVETAIFYVIDRTELSINGDIEEAYVVALIDPSYTTYTSISSSNLRLTAVTYVTSNSITQIKEFPKTPPLISLEHGLVGANIKGYEYNVSKQQSDVEESTCKVIDKTKIIIDGVLTEVCVCVLFSGTTGSNKLHIPFTSITSIELFGIIDYGRPSVLRYTGINFKQDSLGINILFNDVTSGNILRVEPINTLQATGTSYIKIQRTGAEEVIVEGLELATTKINGAAAGGSVAAAISALNTLFTNAGSTIGQSPTITSAATINISVGGTINHAIAGTKIVAINWDISTTGTVPAGKVTTPEGDHRRIIDGTTLAAGTYTIYVTATNYYGSVTQTITINVT